MQQLAISMNMVAQLHTKTPIYAIAHTRKDNGPWRPGTETAHNEYFLINFCLPYKLLKNIKKTES